MDRNEYLKFRHELAEVFKKYDAVGAAIAYFDGVNDLDASMRRPVFFLDSDYLSFEQREIEDGNEITFLVDSMNGLTGKKIVELLVFHIQVCQYLKILGNDIERTFSHFQFQIDMALTSLRHGAPEYINNSIKRMRR